MCAPPCPDPALPAAPSAADGPVTLAVPPVLVRLGPPTAAEPADERDAAARIVLATPARWLDTADRQSLLTALRTTHRTAVDLPTATDSDARVLFDFAARLRAVHGLLKLAQAGRLGVVVRGDQVEFRRQQPTTAGAAAAPEEVR